MKTGKEAVADLKIKALTEMDHKSFLFEKTDAISILNYIDILEMKLTRIGKLK